MDTKRRLAALTLAGLLCGGLVAAPAVAEAGLPAPLPTLIPIRDSNEPPTSVMPATPFVPAPRHQTRHRRKKPVRHRRRAAPRATKTPSRPPAAAATGPTLEQRQEAPIEALIPLDSLVAPTPTPAQPPATGPKPAPSPFPPKPEPAPAPAPAPAKP